MMSAYSIVMVEYSDIVWMNYVKKFEGVYPIELLTRHDGFVIPFTWGFILPYSIDNEELLICFTEQFSSPQEKGFVLRRLKPFVRNQTFDSFILPESNLAKVAKLLGIVSK